ncbi:S-layer homology domain-containing protein [Tepidibacter hydrothermalis]|uniref:S-layer homology domain-containing protein n=1 Tax=Tepidibacter hydrothermalis TaxID=3036126 RepID=A0ABY8EB52_9FIRM|nr:S-layer homology domain-containing protein [Tepidibacter hydrothermalis]WFD10162.1 S-layer homology domain-containing protein [Tepidibacter hydrothermalis]
MHVNLKRKILCIFVISVFAFSNLIVSYGQTSNTDTNSGASKKESTSNSKSQTTKNIKKTTTKTAQKKSYQTNNNKLNDKSEIKKVQVKQSETKVPTKEEVLEYEKKHWAKNDLNKFKDKNIINGYSDDTLKPDKHISRAEFITMVNRIFNLQNKSQNTFEDVDDSSWYASEILKAKEKGYLNGYEINGKFYANPNKDITKEEAATIVANVFQMKNESTNLDFKDKNNISEFAKNSISALYENKYINGYSDKTFRPKNKITRAEAVTMLSRTSGVIVNKPEDIKNLDINSNIIINTKDVNLDNLKVSGNIYITQGVGNGEVTISNSEINKRLFIEGGGKNSIHLDNVKAKNLTVNNKKENVRVVLTGNTKIENVEIMTDSKLELSKDAVVEKLQINEKVKNIKIDNLGEIKKTKVESKEVKINDKKVSRGDSVKISKKKVETKTTDTKSSASKSSSKGKSHKSGGGSSTSSNSNDTSSKNNTDNNNSKNNTGNNNNTNNNNTNKNNQEQSKTIINTDKTRIMEIEGVLYAVVVLNKGSVNDYSFFIDDKAVDMKKVNTSGTIIKSEVTKRDIKTVKLKNSSDEEIFKFGEGVAEEVAKENLIIDDLLFDTTNFKESNSNDGSISNKIKITIKDEKNIKFKSDINGYIDAVSGASDCSKTTDGLRLKLHRIDDKNIEIEATGNALNHTSSNTEPIPFVFFKDLFENIVDDFGGVEKHLHLNFINEPIIDENNYKFIDKDRTEIMEIEGVLYAVLTLKTGTLDDYEIFINNNKLSMQKVNTAGSVLKHELDNRNAIEIKVKKGEIEEKFNLNKN